MFSDLYGFHTWSCTHAHKVTDTHRNTKTKHKKHKLGIFNVIYVILTSLLTRLECSSKKLIKKRCLDLTTASCVLEATVWKTAGIIRDSSTFISMSFSVEKVVLGIAGARSHRIISLLKRKIGFVSCIKKCRNDRNVINDDLAHCSPSCEKAECAV